MIRITLERLLVIGDGLTDRAAALVGQALVMQVRGVVRVELYSRRIIDESLRELLELVPRVPSVKEDVRVLRFKDGSLVEVSERILVLAEVIVCQATVVEIPRAVV